MVMAQALFIRLRETHADCEIHVLAPDWSRPLIDRMPEVKKAIAMPIGHGSFNWQGRKQLGKFLQAEQYDQAIILPNSWKSALIPFFAKAKKRTGWLGEMRYGLLNDARKLDKQAYPLMVERFVALADAAGAILPQPLPRAALQVNKDDVVKSLEKYSLNTSKPVLALCPGAEFGPAKKWPEQYYAEVAQEKLKQGWQVWIYGSVKDEAVAEKIKQQLVSHSEHCHVLAGQTSLAEAIDLLSVADAVVSNDSGLMHIAAALNRTLVAVYGSTSTAFTPPMADKVKTISMDLDCSPCFKRECPLGHLNCLKELKPSMVLTALDNLTDTVTAVSV